MRKIIEKIRGFFSPPDKEDTIGKIVIRGVDSDKRYLISIFNYMGEPISDHKLEDFRDRIEHLPDCSLLILNGIKIDVNEKGEIEKKEVSLGIEGEMMVEIKEGLKEGQRVITSRD